MAAIFVLIETYSKESSQGAPVPQQLIQAHALLQSVLSQSERDVRAVADDFERLAGQTGQVLDLVAVIVACVDNDSVRAILPEVQALGASAQSFIAQRLQATSQIAEVMDRQTTLLEKFCQLAQGQKAIARQTNFLSVLTNIEVANLGELGAGFQYLAHELDEFSHEVVHGSESVAEQAEQRRHELLSIRKKMLDTLPAMQGEFSRNEKDLADTLAGMDQAILGLADNPARFRDCVGSVASEVSSVVAAVQSHDITRQQVEHVMHALQTVSLQVQSQEGVSGRTAALIGIQAEQLKSVYQSTRNWVTRIATCLENLQRVSAADLATIGATILESERLLSSHMERMAALERNSGVDDKSIRASLASLNILMNLMRGHLATSQNARDRMQLLNFNSMIEARQLGSKAAVMVEISRHIRRISGDWSEMTGRSGEAMNAILEMVKAAEDSFTAFSQESVLALRSAQETTSLGLCRLQALADEASQNAARVHSVIAEMQADVTSMRTTARRLESILDLLEQSLQKVELASKQLHPLITDQMNDQDREDLESSLSAMYTTEIERHILRYALYGEPVPDLDRQATGNDIELF